MKPRIILPTFLFTLVALASFSAWAFGSSLFSSELTLYAACAVLFIGLGGVALRPALADPRASRWWSLPVRFALGFLIYAVIWTLAWFTFRDTFGEVLGAAVGLLALAATLRGCAGSTRLLTGTAVIFLFHTLGYHAGEFAYEALQGRGALAIELPFERRTTVLVARLSWGLCYGLGLGYGLSRFLQMSRQS